MENNSNNKKLIIVIIIMALVITGLVGYIIINQKNINENNSVETNKKNGEDTSKTENDTNVKDDNEVIETSITKEKANEQLSNSLGRIYYALSLTSNKVNTNVFDSDYTKLYLAYIMTIEEDGYISEECYSGEIETGCASVDLKKFEEHYYNLHEEKFENNRYEELNKEGSNFGYRDNKFFGSFPTGPQIDIVLKATNIVEKKKTIEVDIDVLNTNDEDGELYNKNYKTSVIEYDNKLVVAKYKLTLDKNTNGTHKIVSFIRVK